MSENTIAYGMESLSVDPSEWKSVLKGLFTDKTTKMNMLVCLWGVDRKAAGVEVCAHLRSIKTGKQIVVKTLVAGDTALASVFDIWEGSELYEDEIYDLFGVKFTGHPFLRRIMMEEDFSGHPLLKSYGKVSQD